MICGSEQFVNAFHVLPSEAVVLEGFVTHGRLKVSTDSRQFQIWTLPSVLKPHEQRVGLNSRVRLEPCGVVVIVKQADVHQMGKPNQLNG